LHHLPRKRKEPGQKEEFRRDTTRTRTTACTRIRTPHDRTTAQCTRAEYEPLAAVDVCDAGKCHRPRRSLVGRGGHDKRCALAHNAPSYEHQKRLVCAGASCETDERERRWRAVCVVCVACGVWRVACGVCGVCLPVCMKENEHQKAGCGCLESPPHKAPGGASLAPEPGAGDQKEGRRERERVTGREGYITPPPSTHSASRFSLALLPQAPLRSRAAAVAAAGRPPAGWAL
jgi:hypothetical protein